MLDSDGFVSALLTLIGFVLMIFFIAFIVGSFTNR